jgi:P4 family phage/plasmid primase-like protien
VFEYPGFAVPNDSSGKVFGPGLDVLSDGDIMVAPPSSHVSVNKYRWAANRPLGDFATMPDTWLDRLRGGSKPETDGTVTDGRTQCTPDSLAGTQGRGGATPHDEGEPAKIVASVSAKARGNEADAAEKLLQLTLDQHFAGGRHLLFGIEAQFWYYDGRVWVVVPETWISGRVLATIKDHPVKGQKTAVLLSQVLTLMKATLAAKDDVLGFVASPPPVINCRNGELWIGPDGSVELRPHRPESHLRQCLEVTYDPDAPCPKYDRALREIFENSGKPNAMARHWNELMGYVIQPRRHIPIIAVLRGGGDNGKTVLVRTLIPLLGDALVYAGRVQNLEKDRFAMGSLFGKLLFVDDDVAKGVRLPDGILKTISEEKEVTGDLKYRPAFNFTVRTVPLLLCNHVPSLADLSHGMRRRLMAMPFDRQFTDDEKDPDLFAAIWATEMSGVLNRAVAGYRRLVKRGSKFEYPSPVIAATEQWLQHANPLLAFIEARCVKGTGQGCLAKTFYAAYVDWTREMGFPVAQTQQSMTRDPAHLGYNIRIRGSRSSVWR